MRNWVSKLALLASLAVCSSTPAQSTGALDVAVANSALPRILVEPDSFICASVTVPQELWPDPLDRYDGPGLSAWLVNSFRQKFIEVGRLGKATRFRTHENNRDPVCNSPSPIYVDIIYNPYNSEVVSRNVLVKSGNIVHKLSGSVNINEEVKSGRVVVMQGGSAIKKVLASDIKITAGEIFDKVFIAK